MNLIEDTKNLIDNLSTAVLVFDSKIHLNSVNAAGEDLLSMSQRTLNGLHVDELFIDFPLTEAMSDCFASGQHFTERDVELRISPDQSIVVDCSLTPLSDSTLPRGVVLECINVDRNNRISREGDILARYQATSALIRGMAHEIKNPLGGLRGAAQLLERELESEDLKEYTGIIIYEADRLRKLIDRILGPNDAPVFETVNIHKILEHIRNLLEAETSDRIIIVQDYDPSLPNIEGDQDQLIQAFLNIVRNAVQAIGDEGSITLKTRVERQFTIENKRHKLMARVDVIDNGSGIPEDLQETIFYPMVTGRAEGTGLGLSIAQTLIHRHNGLIDYETSAEQTTFTVWIPLEIENNAS
ncbi:MAG: nitrogen regulation protein NR(II) [Gammaproteobacteria bacterium]